MACWRPAWLCPAVLALALPALAAEGPSLAPALSPTNFFLTLPGDDRPWVLEETDHLGAPAAWRSLGGVGDLTNAGPNRVTLPLDGTSRFYRLRARSVPVQPITAEWALDDGAGESALETFAGGPNLDLGIAEWSAGRVGPGSLYFGAAADGCAKADNQDYAVLPPPGHPFSLSLWFNPETLPVGRMGLAGNDPTGSNGWSVAVHNLGAGTNLLEFSSAAGQPGVIGRTLLLPGQWHALAVVYDGQKGLIYLNGELLATGELDLLTHDGPLLFGGCLGGSRGFHGRLDEIRAYSYALSSADLEVTGSWDFDEGSGEQPLDRSLHRHEGRLSSSHGWVPGKRGSGIDLTHSELVVPNTDQVLLPPTGRPFSLSFWLRPQALVPGPNRVMSCGVEGTNGWELALDVTSSGEASLRFSSLAWGGTLELRAAVNWATDEWMKIDLTHNGGIAELYVNGRHAGSAHGAIRGTRASLRAGAVGGIGGISATIDELRVYRRARAAAEIGPVALPVWETVFLNTVTNLPLRATAPAGKPLTISILPEPSPRRGQVELAGSAPEVRYTAGPVKGPDLFAYVASDGEFTSAPSTVTVSVVQPHWLSPAGGEELPQDGSRLERAWAVPHAAALDAVWKTNAYYDCFFYAPGVYETHGWKYQERSTANPGCKHIGSGNAGENATIIKLVDIWGAWTEELIFGPGSYAQPCDGFEVHNLVLDCNANQLPKFNQGEPVWIRLPLENPGRVEAVTVHWNSSTILYNVVRAVGRAAEYTLTARLNGAVTFTTNRVVSSATGVEVVAVEAEADELVLELRRRAPGVEFYGINEIEVAGVRVSRPVARRMDGAESRANAQYSILSAVDNDGGSAWGSGPEEQAELEFPLPRGSQVTEIDLQWHCKTEPNWGRFGPAAELRFEVRNQATGEFQPVPFVRHVRHPNGWETSWFGTLTETNTVATDRVRLVLLGRERLVDRYGLKEVRFRNRSRTVPVPVPTALNFLNFSGARTVLRAFDGDYATSWASGTQGGVGAISLAGSNLKFTQLRVKGFGTKAGRECFPFYLMSPRGQGGNVLVEDCWFGEPATNNGDGLTTVTLIQAPPDALTNAVVRRCSVVGVKPHFTYSQGFTVLQAEECLVDGAGFGAYYEPDAQTDDIGSILLRSNRFVNVDHGVFVLFHPGRQFDTLTCIGNEIVLLGQKAGTGIACCDTCSGGLSGSVTNLTAIGNVIRYPDWSPRPGARDLGLFYSDIQHAVFGNNVVVQGAGSDLRVRQHPAGTVIPPRPPEECDQLVVPPPGDPYLLPAVDSLLPGYRRAWFNNRDLSGKLLPVRTARFGVDEPASEQQWRE